VENPIRVLIADDSALMRTLLREFLNADLDIEVVGAAHDGQEAMILVADLLPDVLVMDVEMPRLSGLDALRQIMAKHPLPVIIVSGLQSREFVAESLQLGAVDVICKPSGTISVDIYKIQDELTTKVKAAALTDIRKLLAVSELTEKAATPAVMPRKTADGEPACLVLIAASTGGPRTLEQLLRLLPAGLPAAVLIIQHMPAEFTFSFAERLDQRCPLSVKEASEGDLLSAGNVYIAAGGYHLRVTRHSDGKPLQLHLDNSEPLGSLRPRADLTMRDAAQLFGKRCLGVVLTGMGNDGTAGLASILEAGGVTIAQDRETSAIYGMPRSAADKQVAQLILPPDEIAAEIIRWVAHWD